MRPTVIIDCFPESAFRYREDFTIVAVDVIRATTMAITAAALGRACFPVDSTESAFRLAKELSHPLLAGELAGDIPIGFEMNNSPALLSQRTDLARPLVLLSSSGTQLIVNARHATQLFLACFRNSDATARRLIADGHPRVAIIGAGSRGEFREEDQICCAWIASQLLAAGYAAGNDLTRDVVGEWGVASAKACLISKSADYLRRTFQERDLEFILQRVNDLNCAFEVRAGQVQSVRARPVNSVAPVPVFATI